MTQAQKRKIAYYESPGFCIFLLKRDILKKCWYVFQINLEWRGHLCVLTAAPFRFNNLDPGRIAYPSVLLKCTFGDRWAYPILISLCLYASSLFLNFPQKKIQLFSHIYIYLFRIRLRSWNISFPLPPKISYSECHSITNSKNKKQTSGNIKPKHFRAEKKLIHAQRSEQRDS